MPIGFGHVVDVKICGENQKEKKNWSVGCHGTDNVVQVRENTLSRFPLHTNNIYHVPLF